MMNVINQPPTRKCRDFDPQWIFDCPVIAEACKDVELFEIEAWAAANILDMELMTAIVVDPCCGPGVMAEAAKGAGYTVLASDKYDWGYGRTGLDFLSDDYDRRMGRLVRGATVFMNPPFSLAEAFVRKAFALDARKVVCFQRYAWWESAARDGFWAAFPPNRIYACIDRASCHQINIPPAQRSKKSRPYPHAFFVWESGHAAGTLVGRLRKSASPDAGALQLALEGAP